VADLTVKEDFGKERFSVIAVPSLTQAKRLASVELDVLTPTLQS
jgi:hypothetical protein